LYLGQLRIVHTPVGLLLRTRVLMLQLSDTTI
jgi:hypothetical protein